jgi:hypothetical protein
MKIDEFRQLGFVRSFSLPFGRNALVLIEFEHLNSGDVKGTIPDAIRYHFAPNDIRQHRLISISYISLLPVTATVVRCVPASSYFLFCALIAYAVKRCVHILKFKISLILIEGHDIQRSPCVSAHRIAVISAAWLRTSWGRTIPSGRASLISSVVGDNKSFSM